MAELIQPSPMPFSASMQKARGAGPDGPVEFIVVQFSTPTGATVLFFPVDYVKQFIEQLQRHLDTPVGLQVVDRMPTNVDQVQMHLNHFRGDK